ncbi:hypothetical protein [Vibrio brasiliensis]|uniref:Capsule polysaccharide biosynthesis protein n=1 Tax=Vibrio brasiliensis LMG 20546 TaxID=945543 RepID=E8M048_9VIBR|nr:hypothetical protein [Vibrio brasiliensis]EGA63700.1 hypothetical protein VIBR0546_16441 [Vibrio brasiliensis LMG 20546]
MKKVFFILDWDFSYLWSDIAFRLKSDIYADEEINALVVGKKYFLELSDGTIKHPFNKIYSLDEFYESHIYSNMTYEGLDERIRELEEKYGDETLWKFVWGDRRHIKDGYENNLVQVAKFFDYFENLYVNEKPDVIVTNAFASMPHLISYYVATELGIKVIHGTKMRMALFNYTYWSENYYGSLVPYKPVKPEMFHKAKELLSQFRQTQEISQRDKDVIVQKESIGKEHLKRFFNYSYHYYVTKKYSGHSKPNPFKKLFVEEAIPRMKRFYYKKYFKWDNADLSSKYVYFPLQVQPEATTMTYAHFYMNQLSSLEALSKSVPMGYKIYVKEHPGMLGKNPYSFYKALRKLPNVKIIAMNLDSYDVMKKASLIATISGTTGLEATLLKKPVITMGKVFYNDCKLVKHIGDTAITQWPKVIKEYLDDYRCNDNDILDFLALYFSNSTECMIAEPLETGWDVVMPEKNLESIYLGLSEYLSSN